MSQLKQLLKSVKVKPLSGEQTFAFSDYYSLDFDRLKYDG